MFFRIMADAKDTTEKVESKVEDKKEEEVADQPEGPPTPSANDLQSPTQWFNSYFGSGTEWINKAKEQVLLIQLFSIFICF